MLPPSLNPKMVTVMAKRKLAAKTKKKASELAIELSRLGKWMEETLTGPAALLNFTTLINLPRAQEIAEKLAEGQYRDMALLAITLLKEQEH